MIERCDGAGFSFEALAESLRHQFDGDLPAKAGIDGFVNLSHASGSDETENPKSAGQDLPLGKAGHRRQSFCVKRQVADDRRGEKGACFLVLTKQPFDLGTQALVRAVLHQKGRPAGRLLIEGSFEKGFDGLPVFLLRCHD